MKLKATLMIGAALIGMTMVSAAQAAEAGAFKAGDILVHVRGVAVLPNTSTDFISGSVNSGHVEASQSVVPEIDASYFFTPNISAELIAATTRHHLVAKGTSAGNIDLGRVSLLPPTLTAKYHFMTDKAVIPYLGAGINYTYFFNHDTVPGSAATSIRYKNGWAPAFQAGADVHLTGNWYANVDVKYVMIDTSAKINGGAINADVQLNPVLLGVGLGYKF